jgi:exodeoxyribonuclease-3
MSFKIATWNVNSLRVRLPHLLEWLAANQPDVIALQETKLVDKDFPHAELLEAGYYSVCSGQPSYNGVAIVSRTAVSDSDVPQLIDDQKRVLAVTVQDIRVINIYVPNGAAVGTDKYQYKLAWLLKLSAYLKQQLLQYPKLIVLGDFNIAPEDRDVYDSQAWEGSVLVSEPERQALRALIHLGLHDAFRLFEPAAGHYSWWDYRMGAFRRNHGLRIDHVLLSDALLKNCNECYIDKAIRAAERPSDHVPVVASFVTHPSLRSPLPGGE